MNKRFRGVAALAVIAVSSTLQMPARADLSQPASQKLYDQVSKSLVVVRYVWDSELGRHEITLPGVVVDDHGLVMTSNALFDVRIPESQMKEFKVLRPVNGEEPAELPATFEGRDDRSGMAFVRVNDPASLQPLKFIDHTAAVGEHIYSVGLMPESAGFKPYLTSAGVAVVLRGERFAAAIDGNIAGVGSPVVDADGNGIGFVDTVPAPKPATKKAGPVEANAPDSFTPSHDFIEYLKSPPAGADIRVPWLGVFEMAGLKKAEADYYGLKVPGIQLLAIAEGGPADKAGLRQGQILVALNGKPLERADTVAALPQMLRRQMDAMHAGEKVRFSVVTDKDTPAKDVVVTLAAAPPTMALAKRWWNADLGFGVRDVVLIDRFMQHLTPQTTGVIVSVTKPSAAAAAAHVEPNEFISRFNGEPVADVSDFGTKFEAWRTAHPHDPIILLVSHDGHDETLRIEQP